MYMLNFIRSWESLLDLESFWNYGSVKNYPPQEMDKFCKKIFLFLNFYNPLKIRNLLLPQKIIDYLHLKGRFTLKIRKIIDYNKFYLKEVPDSLDSLNPLISISWTKLRIIKERKTPESMQYSLKIVLLMCSQCSKDISKSIHSWLSLRYITVIPPPII